MLFAHTCSFCHALHYLRCCSALSTVSKYCPKWVKVSASGEGSLAARANTVADGQQGSFGEALGQYFHAYRLLPAEPLLALSIGIAFCNQV